MTKNIGARVVLAATIGGLGAGAVGGYLATHAWADGVPQSPGSIYYAGEISRIDGAAPPTSAMIGIELWDGEDAAATSLCTVAPRMVSIVEGHFRIPLDQEHNDCVDAIHENPDVWVEVRLSAETLPRQHVGAVPYALEADRLVAFRPDRAIGATVGGVLCGATPPTTGRFTAAGGLGGYRAARAQCVTACGGSPTAHMCTGAELALSEQLGVSPPVVNYAWYASGAGGGDASETELRGDCVRWTSNAATYVYTAGGPALRNFGSSWGLGRTTGPDHDTCNISRPIACCD